MPVQAAKSTSPANVILIIVGSVFAMLLMFAGLGALFVWSSNEEPLAEAERGLLIDPLTIFNAMGHEYRESALTWTKTTYIDRSYEFTVEYDAAADELAPYLINTISVETKTSDALSAYGTLLMATKATIQLLGEDITIKDSDIYQWGDNSTFSVMYSKGLPFGTMFHARNGKIVYQLMISGVYYDDRESFEPIVRASLLEVEAKLLK